MVIYHFIDVPVMKGGKSFFKLYHLRTIITGTSLYTNAPCNCYCKCSL